MRSELNLQEGNFIKEIENLKQENIKLKNEIKKRDEIEDDLDKMFNENKEIVNSISNLKNRKLTKYNKCLNLINAIKRKDIEISTYIN